MSARLGFATLLVLTLAACSEPSQEVRSGTNTGEPLYAGTGSNFVASGWKPGDKASWARELNLRTQRGQNEYNRVH